MKNLFLSITTLFLFQGSVYAQLCIDYNPIKYVVNPTNATCAGQNDGSATVVLSGGKAPYTYSWAPSGGNAATANNLAPGNYVVTINSAGCNILGGELVVNGDFESGNTGFSSDYSYNSSSIRAEGVYAIGKAAVNYHSDFSFNTQDHTTGSGNFMMINGSSNSGAKIWQETVALTPNTDYYFSFWVFNLTANNDPKCQFTINGTALGYQFTPQYTAYGNPGNYWEQFCIKWNSGSATSGTIKLQNFQTAPSGNDFAIDDISFRTCNNQPTVANVTITSPANFTPSVTTTAISCKGDATGSATASVAGGGTYTYLWNTNPSQTTTTVVGLKAGPVTVTVTNSAGCSAVQTITVAEPTAILNAPQTTKTDIKCKGDKTGSAVIAPSGGTPAYTISWNTNPIQNTPTANGLSAGTYVVLVTDVNNCTATSSITITEPLASLTNNNTTTSAAGCTVANGSATANPTGGTAPYTYLWSNNQVSQTANGLTNGSYNVKITDSNGCTTTTSVTISTTTAVPTSAIVQTTSVSCNGGNNGSATVSASGGTAPLTYAWTPSGGNNATANNLTKNTYNCIVTDANGCTAISTVNIQQPNAPVSLSLTCGDSICKGFSTTLKAIATGGTGAGYTYTWQPNSTQGNSITVQPTTTTNYVVTVVDKNGCTSSNTYTCQVVVFNQPTAKFDSISSASVPPVYTFKNLSTGGTKWLWDFGDGTNSNLKTPEHKYASGGTYTVTQTVQSKDGCEDKFSMTIHMPGKIIFPNVFTPNGDHNNDTWYIPTTGVKDFRVEIFDRWGIKVWESNSEKTEWDGTSMTGTVLSDGTYYFIFSGKLKTENGDKDYIHKGYIELLRGK